MLPIVDRIQPVWMFCLFSLIIEDTLICICFQYAVKINCNQKSLDLSLVQNIHVGVFISKRSYVITEWMVEGVVLVEQ